MGESDPLTPVEAVDRAYRETRAAYAALGAEARLSLLSEPHTAHRETVRMRQSMLAFFRQHLG